MTATTELLTVPQVMARLQLGRSAVYDLLRTRQLASITLGRAPAASAHPPRRAAWPCT
ncbi:DNA-binding protein [Streptomyces sp. NPDC087212]|uniref:DNA-binding protein n=1 Tax=Streptomyces sp. NPDC087212 TaxID=3365766 RepID=UPI003815EE96